MASASPNANMAVVLEVGARPMGQASAMLPTRSAASAACASGLSGVPVIEIRGAPIFLMSGMRRITSLVVPL